MRLFKTSCLLGLLATACLIQPNPAYNDTEVGTDTDGDTDPGTDSEGVFVECSEQNGSFCYGGTLCFALDGRASRNTTGDFDGDGDLDVIVALPLANLIQGMRNEGDGVLVPQFSRPVGGGPVDVVFLPSADTPRLAVASRDVDRVSIFTLRDQIAEEPLRYDVAPQPIRLRSIDVTGDQLDDLVVATRVGAGFQVLTATPDGGFEVGPLISVGETPADFDVGDLDADGDMDVVIANNEGSVSIAYATSPGVFEEEIVLIPVVADPGGADGSDLADFSSVAVADLNNDTILDIAFGVGTVNALYLLHGNGAGFEPTQSVPAGQEPHSIVATEVNGDGIIDVGISLGGGKSVQLFAGEMPASFETSSSVPLIDVGVALSFADLNGDALPDVLSTIGIIPQLCVAFSDEMVLPM